MVFRRLRRPARLNRFCSTPVFALQQPLVGTAMTAIRRHVLCATTSPTDAPAAARAASAPTPMPTSWPSGGSLGTGSRSPRPRPPATLRSPRTWPRRRRRRRRGTPRTPRAAVSMGRSVRWWSAFRPVPTWTRRSKRRRSSPSPTARHRRRPCPPAPGGQRGHVAVPAAHDQFRG